MIKDTLQNMNEVLKELLLGILLAGVVLEVLFLCFASDRWYFTTGLLIGVALALFLAIHMNHSVERTLEVNEEDAQGYMQKMAVLRMGIVVLVLGAACFLRLGSGISMFAGVLTLKFSAYLQPVLHRLLQKRKKRR